MLRLSLLHFQLEELEKNSATQINSNLKSTKLTEEISMLWNNCNSIRGNKNFRNFSKSFRYESFIGVHALRKYVLNLTWKSYQESIPRILKQFRAKKVETERKIKEVEHQQSVKKFKKNSNQRLEPR